jgi:hypothetical protein
MKNNSNIFEELNKMKNLIHAKAGTVISEQDAAAAGIAGASTGTATAGTADTANTAGTAGTAGTDTAAARTRQQNVNSIYCSVRNGIITNKSSQFKGTKWASWVSTFAVKPAEITAAEAVCPRTATLTSLTPAQVTQKFADSAKTLGIQNPQMDVATLQTILNTLNQGGSGLTESKNPVNEELNMMKYLLGYQRGKVISEQDAAAAAQPTAEQPTAAQPTVTPQDLIGQIQTLLNTKFKEKLTVDKKWGNMTQTALENALKSMGDLSQRRAAETKQTTTQDAAIQQAAEKGRMAIPQTNNLPQVAGVQTK